MELNLPVPKGAASRTTEDHNVFIHKNEDYDIIYVIHAANEDTAIRKLIPELDTDTKAEHIYISAYIDDNRYSYNDHRCQICDAIIRTEDKTMHLETHSEEQINKILMTVSWFSESKIKTIY